MAEKAELHVIFGSGPLGRAVMYELLQQGKAGHIHMINRNGQTTVPQGVEVKQADATNPASTRVVCAGAAVVYQCAQPAYTEWPQKFPAYQDGIIEGAAANGASLVVAENLYMYGRVSGPITEDLSFNPVERKGEVRARMAESLMAAHRAGKVRAVAGRASNFYGPEAAEQGAFGNRVIFPMLAGKKVSALGKINMPHTYSYVADFGRSLALLGSRPEAYGQAWHIPNAPTLSTRQILEMFFKEAGLPPKIGKTPDLALKVIGLFVPVIREVSQMLYEFNEPFIVDHSKFEKAFGNNATPHQEAIQKTLAWFKIEANKLDHKKG